MQAHGEGCIGTQDAGYRRIGMQDCGGGRIEMHKNGNGWIRMQEDGLGRSYDREPLYLYFTVNYIVVVLFEKKMAPKKMQA